MLLWPWARHGLPGVPASLTRPGQPSDRLLMTRRLTALAATNPEVVFVIGGPGSGKGHSNVQSLWHILGVKPPSITH